jgi:hypothetical protein
MQRFLASLPQRLAGIALGATFIAATLVPATATAAPTVRLAGNATAVTFSGAFTGALGALGLDVDPLGNTALGGGRAFFPISSGAIDAANARGEILHLGGLRLEKGPIRVDLSDFVIDTTGTPRLTGLVVANGDVVGRIPLFDLALPHITLPLTPVNGRFVRISSVGVTLTADAAAALNQVFGVSAFTAGFDIGTADVRAVIRRNLSPHLVHVPRGRDGAE